MNRCYICGFSSVDVPGIQPVQVVDDRTNKIITIFAHPECHRIAVEGNHPITKQMLQESPEPPSQGFIKPRSSDDYPSVRPI